MTIKGLPSLWHYCEKNIGSLKFAVVVITLFAVGMMVGTLLESYYGTDFANRIVYKNWPFMLVQFCMFLSILFAAFSRLPPRKRLYGFYTVHTGLILLGAGSLVTYLAGIDGSIFLSPGQPSREVQLSQDTVLISRPQKNKQMRYLLPYTAFKRELGAKYEELDIELLTYLPYASQTLNFVPPKQNYNEGSVNSKQFHSGHYMLSNDNVTQDFWLSLHPEAQDFDSSLKLGPLSIHYLPKTMAPCFSTPSQSQLVLWNNVSGECYTPEEKNIAIKKSNLGRDYLQIHEESRTHRFFPEFSPWPMDEKLSPIKDSPMRIFSKKLFTKTPNLFIFGDSAAYYDKDEQRWHHSSLKDTKFLQLPWMGFELSMLKYEEEMVPKMVPQYTMPIQSENKLIKGDERAVLVRIGNEKIWISTQNPREVFIKGEPVQLQIAKQSLLLPFEFILDRFEMKTNPGTNTPASFESFVTVFTNEGPEEHHVYMNNPLKKGGFTFYQASYSQDGDGNYSSTLSVNLDPGRPIKYAGSLFLVLGAIWHYNLRRKKIEKKTASNKGDNRNDNFANDGTVEVGA